jgi:hypothetical protein
MDRVTLAVTLLLAAVAAPCLAQDATKGMQMSSVQGYTFGSEVGGKKCLQLNMDKQLVCNAGCRRLCRMDLYRDIKL